MELERLREALRAAPETLRGLAVLMAAALVGTLALSLMARPAPVPPPVVMADEPLVVHVAGQVTRPGLYRLDAGARVADAITAAGGPLPSAHLERLNLARPLDDGEQLVVPGPDPPAGAGGGAASVAARPDGRLDLNRASAAELEALPGIGPVLATRIVQWREQRGGFRSLRDLRRVRGIGEKLYRAIVELVAV